MKTRHPLAGIYAAALTPLNADFSVAPEAVLPYLNILASRGCHGALLFGTTGEGPSFGVKEREIILRAALDVRQTYPNFHLLAGTGSPSLDDAVTLTRAAFEIGFDGVVTLPPYYFRKASDDGLFLWFDTILRRAVPEGKYLLGYHIPAQAGIGLSLDLLSRLKDAHPQKFAGIKDSSGDPDHAVALGARFGPDLLVLNGNDGLALHALEHHAGGAITAMANLYSNLLRQVWNIYEQDGDSIEAQDALNVRRKIIDRYAPFPPILKAIMPHFMGLPRWPVRPPLMDVSPETAAAAIHELETC
jgi:4-hydroxy-tetrahydrodipicolinate synthase